MDVAVILPTYNERENVPIIVERLTQALGGFRWEAIFVDDDSPDGTATVVSECASVSSNVRLIHRIGRRGLASACIEGTLSSQAPLLVVMDADLQHDEKILPQMLDRLRRESLDVVIATRNAQGGSMGEFGRTRVLLSQFGRKVSETVCRSSISDPMSGFFAIRRDYLLEVVHGLQGGGFKILVDLLASSRRPVRIGEVGYTFGERRHGESKLDVAVGVEYLAMIANRLTGGIVPTELTMYLVVGGIGLMTYVALLLILVRGMHLQIFEAQAMSTLAAMSENFVLNNRLTFRDRRLQGARLLSGGMNFLLVCSFGAWANVVLTLALLHSGVDWFLAGLCGILLGSVWNLSISSQFTWRQRRRPAAAVPRSLALVEGSR